MQRFYSNSYTNIYPSSLFTFLCQVDYYLGFLLSQETCNFTKHTMYNVRELKLDDVR